jgi:hypothetical protein
MVFLFNESTYSMKGKYAYTLALAISRPCALAHHTALAEMNVSERRARSIATVRSGAEHAKITIQPKPSPGHDGLDSVTQPAASISDRS